MSVAAVAEPCRCIGGPLASPDLHGDSRCHMCGSPLEVVRLPRDMAPPPDRANSERSKHRIASELARHSPERRAQIIAVSNDQTKTFDFIARIPGVGPRNAKAILAAAGLRSFTRIDGLIEAERVALAGALNAFMEARRV